MKMREESLHRASENAARRLRSAGLPTVGSVSRAGGRIDRAGVAVRFGRRHQVIARPRAAVVVQDVRIGIRIESLRSGTLLPRRAGHEPIGASNVRTTGGARQQQQEGCREDALQTIAPWSLDVRRRWDETVRWQKDEPARKGPDCTGRGPHAGRRKPRPLASTAASLANVASASVLGNTCRESRSNAPGRSTRQPFPSGPENCPRQGLTARERLRG
jgi:hypothetical protein